jgi:guanine deaminase
VNFTQQLHPDCSGDAQVYDQAGLLTSRSIFAHGTQLTEQEMQLMAQKEAAVAHCPLSNFYFGDGELRFLFAWFPPFIAAAGC